MKRYTFLVLSLALLLFVGAGCWTTTYPAATTNTNANTNVAVAVKAQLVITNPDGEPTTYDASVVPGTTALALLKQVGQENTIAIVTKQYDFGELVTAIGGTEASSTDFWLFSINGESASVGAGSYTVKEGDTIAFTYTKGE